MTMQELDNGCSFFPSFPANHENNPAADKAGNA
jgi:hypothetical protein